MVLVIVSALSVACKALSVAGEAGFCDLVSEGDEEGVPLAFSALLALLLELVDVLVVECAEVSSAAAELNRFEDGIADCGKRAEESAEVEDERLAEEKLVGTVRDKTEGDSTAEEAAERNADLEESLELELELAEELVVGALVAADLAPEAMLGGD